MAREVNEGQVIEAEGNGGVVLDERPTAGICGKLVVGGGIVA